MQVKNKKRQVNFFILKIVQQIFEQSPCPTPAKTGKSFFPPRIWNFWTYYMECPRHITWKCFEKVWKLSEGLKNLERPKLLLIVLINEVHLWAGNQSSKTDQKFPASQTNKNIHSFSDKPTKTVLAGSCKHSFQIPQSFTASTIFFFAKNTNMHAPPVSST